MGRNALGCVLPLNVPSIKIPTAVATAAAGLITFYYVAMETGKKSISTGARTRSYEL